VRLSGRELGKNDKDKSVNRDGEKKKKQERSDLEESLKFTGGQYVAKVVTILSNFCHFSLTVLAIGQAKKVS